MSSLWTPSGEHVPEPDASPTAAQPRGGQGGGPGGGPSAEELDAIRRLHYELIAAPVEDVLANHVAGLLQLALVLLGLATPPDDEGRVPAPDLVKASVVIDAVSAVVDGLGQRLGAHEAPLRETLAQVQTAYVEVSDALDEEGAP